MNGVPLELVENATMDQLDVMYEIVRRNMKDQASMQAYGIGLAFGGSKNE